MKFQTMNKHERTECNHGTFILLSYRYYTVIISTACHREVISAMVLLRGSTSGLAGLQVEALSEAWLVKVEAVDGCLVRFGAVP